MIGGFWPVLNRIATNCVWYAKYFLQIASWKLLTSCDRIGIQTYFGGQSVKIVLGALIGPKYAYMTNTLPLSAHVDTCNLVSFFIFLVIFCPMLLIRPEKLQTPVIVSGPIPK
jgi:nucleobase:cation symporter-1, NCS1 family